MPVIKDTAKYDQLHARLLRELLVAIRDELEGSDIDHEHVYDLTGKIGSAVAAVIDGVSPTTGGDGERLHPFLAFSAEGQPDTLIVNEQGSYLHGLVETLFEGMFEEQEDEDEEYDEEEDEEEYEDDDDEDEYEEDEDDEDEDEDEGNDQSGTRPH